MALVRLYKHLPAHIMTTQQEVIILQNSKPAIFSLGDYMHSRSEALRRIPKNVLERPFLDMIGFGNKVPKHNGIFEFDFEEKTKPGLEQQKLLNQALINAIKINDLNAIGEALDRGADPNADTGKSGRTIFILAVRKAKLEIIERLLDRGADPNAKDNVDNTPLMHATATRRLDVVEVLLTKNVDLYAKNKNNKNALDIANELKLEKTTGLLIRHMRQEPKEKEKGPTAEESERLNEQLIAAAKKNDLESAKEALAKGADKNARDKEQETFGRTPLMWTACNDSFEVADFLMKNDADVNATDSTERTALIHAAQRDSMRMVQLLLDNHANVHAHAYFWAVTNNNEEMKGLLLQKGAIPLVEPTIAGQPPNSEEQKKALNEKMLAHAHKLEWEEVRKILESGADPDAKDEDEWTVLAHAACAGNMEIADLALEKGADVDSMDCIGSTPLMKATRFSHYNMVDFLLKHNAYPDKQNHYFESALSIAQFETHNADITALLNKRKKEKMRSPLVSTAPLQSKAPEPSPESVRAKAKQEIPAAEWASANTEPSRTPTLKMAPMTDSGPAQAIITKRIMPMLDISLEMPPTENDNLLAAARSHDIERVRKAIDSGANVDARNENEMTALMTAAAAGNMDLLSFLKEKNADPNLKNIDGNTALMLAAGNGHPSAAGYLISMGAKVKETNKEGKTALDLASQGKEKSHADVVGIIKKAEAQMELNSMLISAIVMGFTDGVRELLDRGAEVNYKDESGRIPLILATIYPNEEIVKLFISRKANTELRDNNGWTALKHAAAEGETKIAKIMIPAKADPNARDKYLRTPLIEAAYYGQYEMAEILLLDGADPNLKDKNGNMASDHAAANGHTDIMELIRKFKQGE